MGWWKTKKQQKLKGFFFNFRKISFLSRGNIIPLSTYWLKARWQHLKFFPSSKSLLLSHSGKMVGIDSGKRMQNFFSDCLSWIKLVLTNLAFHSRRNNHRIERANGGIFSLFFLWQYVLFCYFVMSRWFLFCFCCIFGCLLSLYKYMF